MDAVRVDQEYLLLDPVRSLSGRDRALPVEVEFNVSGHVMVPRAGDMCSKLRFTTCTGSVDYRVRFRLRGAGARPEHVFRGAWNELEALVAAVGRQLEEARLDWE